MNGSPTTDPTSDAAPGLTTDAAGAGPTTTPGSPLAAPAPTPSRSGRRIGAGHVVAIVVGCLSLFPGLGMLAGGTALAIAEAAATDDDGYYAFTVDRVDSAGAAVTTSDLWFDDDEGGPWVLDWLDLDVRLRVDGPATAAGDERNVFVGIARSADVEAYLDGVRHSVVTELDDRAPVYRHVTGAETLTGAPGDQTFWAASTSGEGEQELTWEARGGRWSIVVMNADGSPGVAADVEIGARSDAVAPIAITLLIVGGVITLVAAGLIVFGARGRRERTPVAVGPTFTRPFDDRPS
jgi:hypothetical protein